MRLGSGPLASAPPEPVGEGSAPELFADTPYQVIRPLGTGGMGEVFLVEHTSLRRNFVAKVLHSRFARHEQLIDRFRVEAQALARLKHPHIVSIKYPGKTSDGRPFFVTEFLQGRTLAQELRHGELPMLEALEFFGQLLSALSAAHAIGIVHRDIKPGNIFLSETPDGRRVVKLLDFGVARIMPDAPVNAPSPLILPTATGVVVGTPSHVSPEGALALPVDPRADLYTAALVLYRMLAGRGPFDHLRTDQQLLEAHAFEPPAPPSFFSKQPVPPELDRAVLRALQKDPGQRFQTASEFKAAVDECAQGLRRSAGWLETSLFDPAQATNMQNRTLELETGAPDPGSADTDYPAQKPEGPPTVEREARFTPAMIAFAVLVAATVAGGMIAMGYVVLRGLW